MDSLGLSGERAAASYFEKKGFTVLARDLNYGSMGQLDLVCSKSRTLYIIEVKTRSHKGAYGGPSQAVSRQQLARLKRCAMRYSQDIGWDGNIRLLLACLVKTNDYLRMENIAELF